MAKLPYALMVGGVILVTLVMLIPVSMNTEGTNYVSLDNEDYDAQLLNYATAAQPGDIIIIKTAIYGASDMPLIVLDGVVFNIVIDDKVVGVVSDRTFYNYELYNVNLETEEIYNIQVLKYINPDATYGVGHLIGAGFDIEVRGFVPAASATEVAASSGVAKEFAVAEKGRVLDIERIRGRDVSLGLNNYLDAGAIVA